MATLRCRDVCQASVFAELQPKDVLDLVFGSIFCGTADASSSGRAHQDISL